MAIYTEFLTVPLLEEERPELEAEAAKIAGDIATAEGQLGRYYRAFEAGTMAPETCGSRVAEIEAHVATLRARRAALAERAGRLAMPALDLNEVAALMDDFERVFESGFNAQKKHLLHRLVKEVRVQDRDTAEVWYSFPRPAAADQRTADSHIWLRGLVSVRAVRTGFPKGSGLGRTKTRFPPVSQSGHAPPSRPADGTIPS